MSLTLTTFASGAVIDATVLRAKLLATETYLNESILAADRGSQWLRPNHVYRPDFFGDPNPHSTFPTGESYFRQKSSGDRDRAFFSYYLGTGIYPIPGLSVPIQVPETLSQGTNRYRLVVRASLYAYDFGGIDSDPACDEVSNLAAAIGLWIPNMSPLIPSYLTHYVHKGSQTDITYSGAFYPRKQISFCACIVGNGSFPVGVNNVALTVSPFVSATTVWKHLVVTGGNIMARYWLR